MLENLTWSESSFISLTYAEEFVPTLETGLTTLASEQLVKWVKRLRKAVGVPGLRYFAVGEYGDVKERPHYHAAVFGYKGCEYEDSGLSPDELCRCASCVLLRATWRVGFVHQGTVELKSMQYLCSYMLKGMYRRDDRRLCGREPEFRRMSLRPGIGAAAAVYLAESLRLHGMGNDGVTPSAYRFGSRILPIGKYVRGKVREALGRDKKASEAEVEWAKERMRPLYEIAARLSEKTVSECVSDKLLYRVIVEANREKARQLEAREKIFNRSRK